ncbi:MAG TPA: response regulator transcription factor [Gemmatimonadaceae bacterium]|jgi:two-component system NarL family response regulator|nr:response regulator transcription factor [Gemmatimonadaceae bacterium]
MADAIRVLLADDHAIVRGGVAHVLNEQEGIAVVAEAVDGAQAIELYLRHRPDVALVDLRMPGLEGVEVVERIRETVANAVIAMLTTFEADDDIDRSFRAGAKAYLLKDIAPQDLVACVRAVHAGRAWVSSGVAAKLAARMTRRVHLTPREMAVLRLLASGKSNREIAVALSITVGTVKVHLAHLFEKLNVASRTEAIATAVRRGLVRVA